MSETTLQIDAIGANTTSEVAAVSVDIATIQALTAMIEVHATTTNQADEEALLEVDVIQEIDMQNVMIVIEEMTKTGSVKRKTSTIEKDSKTKQN